MNVVECYCLCIHWIQLFYPLSIIICVSLSPLSPSLPTNRFGICHVSVIWMSQSCPVLLSDTWCWFHKLSTHFIEKSNFLYRSKGYSWNIYRGRDQTESWNLNNIFFLLHVWSYPQSSKTHTFLAIHHVPLWLYSFFSLFSSLAHLFCTVTLPPIPPKILS